MPEAVDGVSNVAASQIPTVLDFESREISMKKLILVVGAVILSVVYFAEPAVAQDASDIAGSWTLTIEPPNRGGGGGGRGGGRGGRGGGLFSAEQTLVFALEEEMLSGTHEAAEVSTELTGVTFRGNEISFTLARQTQRGALQITFNGEVDGDTMTGTFEVGQQQFTINWTATRSDN